MVDQVADLHPPEKQVQIDTDKFLFWELRQMRWQIYQPLPRKW